MRQYYKIIDTDTGDVLADHLTSNECGIFFGMSIQHVARAVRYGYLMDSRYVIMKDNVLGPECEKQIPDYVRKQLAAEWSRVTSYIQKRVIWCKTPGEGVRQLSIRHSSRSPQKGVQEATGA